MFEVIKHGFGILHLRLVQMMPDSGSWLRIQAVERIRRVGEIRQICSAIARLRR